MSSASVRLGVGVAIAFLAVIGASSADAGLVADGVTYNLFETPLTATTAQFDLNIAGINGPSDTEGARSGVEAFALTPPANFSGATLSGFTEMNGGLNANACDGSGNFFCFKANTTPPATPALAVNSTLDLVFDMTLSSGTFAGYSPAFKINWVGSKNHYDLVSDTLTPTPVPAPPIGHGLVILLAIGSVLSASKLLESSS